MINVRARAGLGMLILLLICTLTAGTVGAAPAPSPAASPATGTKPAVSPPADSDKDDSDKDDGGKRDTDKDEDRSEAVSNVASAMGTIQSYLEFYFMETGQYPEALEDMLSQYNQGVRQNEPLVKIPTDPATGRKFIYTPTPDRDAYTLRAPDPAAYGLGSLRIQQVDWGWMKGLAAEQKKKRLTARCAQFMQLVVDVVEQYNKANRNRFPDKLATLMPKYLQKPPTCPLCKKEYIYTHTDRGFDVACPEPKAHGLDEFRFSSTEGLKKYP